MTLNFTKLAAVLVIPPLLAGCDAGGEGAGEPAQEGAAVSAAGEQAQTGGTIQLAPIDRSGVSGTVRTDRSSEALSLTMSVEGLEPGSTYAAHVHDGRCAAGGPVRAPLGEFTSEGQNPAQVEAELDAVPADEPVFVQVHAPDGTAIACADLPGGEEPSLMTEVDDSVPGTGAQ